MSAWSKILGPNERAEVESGVVSSYIDPQTGETRTTRAAKAEFVEFVREAQAAGREWADIMLAEWAEAGAGNFAAKLWKRRDAFTTTVRGAQRSRSLYRGKRIRSESGDAEDLRAGIVAEAMRAKEARINLDTYAALLRLLESTDADLVSDGLACVGMSLDEYLATDDERRAS